MMEFPEAIIVRSCDNCRNKNTKMQFCKDWKKWQRDNFRQTGKPYKKRHCKFWSYNPTGLWRTQP